MMHAVLFFLAFAFSSQSGEELPVRQLYVYLDGGRESRIMESELTRDWAKIPSAELAIWEARRIRLASRVTLIRLKRYELDVFPAYAWSRNVKPEPFDHRFFAGSGRALFSLETMIDDVVENFSYLPGDPQYVAPELPPKPRILFPWEQQ